jgi:hypothetical protein
LYCYIYYIFYYDHEKEKTAFCMREAEKSEKKMRRVKTLKGCNK